jgi:hypothetical protein
MTGKYGFNTASHTTGDRRYISSDLFRKRELALLSSLKEETANLTGNHTTMQ